jgi:FkbM family methyltransferase
MPKFVQQESTDDMLRRFSTIESTPNKLVDYMQQLAASVQPTVIYDVGACTLNWTKAAQKVWPNAKIFVFDANPQLYTLYSKENVHFHIGALADTDNKAVKLYTNHSIPNGASCYRKISRAFHETSFAPLTAMTLDSVVGQKNLPLPDLIHMDVDGSEKDILSGALRTMNNASNLLISMQKTAANEGAPLQSIVTPWIESQGWRCSSSDITQCTPYSFYGFSRH